MPVLRRIAEKYWELHRRYIGLSSLQLAERVRLPLVFFHIPRTGGITFHEILTRIAAPGGSARHLPATKRFAI